MKKIFPLNQILYGVPGTGKTYMTAAYAVAIKREYNQLCADGRINFLRSASGRLQKILRDCRFESRV